MIANEYSDEVNLATSSGKGDCEFANRFGCNVDAATSAEMFTLSC